MYENMPKTIPFLQPLSSPTPPQPRLWTDSKKDLPNIDGNWENSPRILWCYALVCPGMQETVLQKIPVVLNDGTKGHSVTKVLKMGVNDAAHTCHVFLGSPPPRA